MKYKAVFFDMDGTLMEPSQHVVPESAIDAISALQKNDIKVFLATGRHSSVFPVFPQINAIPFDGYLTSNGQHCYDKSGTIHMKTIPLDDKKALVDVINKHNIPVMFLNDKSIQINLIDKRVDTVDDGIGKVDYSIFDPKDSFDQDILALLMCDGEESEKLIMNAMPNCVSMRWINYFADIFPRGGGKALGIKKMLEHYSIDQSETMAFGDATNDIDMLEYVHTGVAMGNGKPDLKAVADYITDDVMNDGVMKALKHFKLI